MNILIIGPSPTLLTQSGQIHRSLIEELAKEHNVSLMVWHHDIEYFMPNQYEKSRYAIGGHIVDLYPYLEPPGRISAFAFNTMKITQPNVVISIGNYYDCDFLGLIKSVYGELFKWISIIPHGDSDIKSNYGINISYADRIISTTKKGTDVIKKISGKCEYVPFGINTNFIMEEKKYSLPSAITMAKNNQNSNLPSIIQASATSDLPLTIHTNLHDVDGDYDIKSLIRKTGKVDLFKLPEKYVSVKEGYPEKEIFEQYKRHNIVIDCSIQSTTGLSMLEGMAMGCLPIGSDSGALGEILKEMPESYRFIVPTIKFTIQREETVNFINTKDLSDILNIVMIKACEKDWFVNASKVSSSLAQKFSRENFVFRVKKMVETVVNERNCISVDTF